jgi:hypothetical protein
MQLIKQSLAYINHNLEYIVFFVLVAILAVLILNRSWECFLTKAKGINQLDAIIYINLENRGDRKDLLIKELDALQTDMSKVYKISGVYMPKNGHKGCLQLHVLALNMIKLNAQRWKRVLILEDNVEIIVDPDVFNNTITKALEKLDVIDPDWNVLMLATAYKITSENKNTQELEIKNSKEEKVPMALERLKSATTSSAYIIRENYVDKILELFNTCNQHLQPDKLNEHGHKPWALDQQWLKLQEMDHWYSLNPDPIKQRAIWSTINVDLAMDKKKN